MGDDTLLKFVNWQITFACQLRCTHCYTESGRRASRRLRGQQLFTIADKLIAAGIQSVQLTGGEPLLVPEALEIARRLQAAGIAVHLYTNGLDITPESAPTIVRLFPEVHVSVDGPNAEVHDPIRGRAGAFDATVSGLRALDEAAKEYRPAKGPFGYGVEVTLVRSNFDHVDEFMTTFARRFDRNRFFALAPAIPSGLANRESYVERELLTEAQLEQVRDPAFARRLQSLAPPGVAVSVSDNFFLQFHPEQVKRGEAADQMLEIEPNGAVRGLIIYEGVVGNVLEEPLDTLWRRAQQRVHDPVVVAELGGAKTMAEWATAARNIDQHFASEEDRRRIHERRVHSGHPNRRSLPQLRHADASVEP